MSQFLKAFILALASMISTVVFAQEVFELERIQVIAEKNFSLFTFSPVFTVPSFELQSSPTGIISSEFTNIPGVITTQNGGPGGRTTFFIRGTESRHVSFTLDGLKLNDPSNTDRQFDAAFFSSPMLQTMKLYKGPQAVLLGSDSMGGVVELITRKGENAPETRFIINAGSFGTLQSSLAQDWSRGGNHGTLTASKFHTDGISRLNKKRFNAKEADAADSTQLSSSSRHSLNKKTETQLLFSYLRGFNELDGATTDNAFDTSLNDQYLAQQKTNYHLNSNQAISLRTGLNRHLRYLSTLAVGKESYAGDLVQNELLWRWSRKEFQLLSGLSTEHEDVSLSHLRKSFDLHSVFTQSSYQWDKIKFQAGVRAESHTRYGEFFTGSTGFSFSEKYQTWSLQYSRGYKAPSLYQLHAPSLFGPPIGNANLVPEVNHSLEGSWNLRKGIFEADLAYFRNSLSNLITYTTSQGYLNQGRFVVEGIEASGKLHLHSFLIHSSYISQKFREAQQTVLRRPLNSAQLGVKYFPAQNWELQLNSRWFSSRKDLTQTGKVVRLNGYEVLDFELNYKIHNWDFGGQILNILNRDYEDLYGYSVMPRSLFTHVGWRF